MTSRDVKDAYYSIMIDTQYSVMINTNTEEHLKYDIFCTEKLFLKFVVHQVYFDTN